MESHPEALSLERLLRHSDWLDALARRLAVACAAFSSYFSTRKFTAPLKFGSPGTVVPSAVTNS